MTSLLSQVKKGKIRKPYLVLLYGPDGVGKSTFGAMAPSPIFLGTEQGTNELDVERLPAPSTWSDVRLGVTELTNEKHSYKTLVIDSADWLEPILHQSICDRHNVASIELAAGGYGKGYLEAVTQWSDFTKALAKLRDTRGMNIIIIAHSEVVKFNDPSTQSEYDRYQLKLYRKSAALLREFVDSVLFATFEVHSKKEGQRTRMFGDGARVMYTERRPAFDAKNRCGLPLVLPLSWDDFDKASQVDHALDAGPLADQIKAMISEIKDPVLVKAVNDSMIGADVMKLSAIKNRLEVRLGQ